MEGKDPQQELEHQRLAEEQIIQLSRPQGLLEELRFIMEYFSEATGMGPLMKHLVRFCIYAGGQRPFEMISNQWSAIDWQQKTLLVIADVSKNKHEHLIPLTESALKELSLIKELTNESHNPYIFPLSTKISTY